MLRSKWKDVKITLKKMLDARHSHNVLMDQAEVDVMNENSYNLGYKFGVESEKRSSTAAQIQLAQDWQRSRAAAYSKALSSVDVYEHLLGIVKTYYWEKLPENKRYDRKTFKTLITWEQAQWRWLRADKLEIIRDGGLRVEMCWIECQGPIPATFCTSGSEWVKSKASKYFNARGRTLVKNISWRVADTNKETGLRKIECISLTKNKQKYSRI